MRLFSASASDAMALVAFSVDFSLVLPWPLALFQLCARSVAWGVQLCLHFCRWQGQLWCKLLALIRIVIFVPFQSPTTTAVS